MNPEENSPLPKPTTEDRMRGRFQTATGGLPPTDRQRDTVRTLTEQVVALGTAIEDLVPPGRNKALAMTALEDVQMRANRAVFQDQPDENAFRREEAR